MLSNAWKPLDSAPKDGTPILVVTRISELSYGYRVCYYNNDRQCFVVPDYCSIDGDDQLLDEASSFWSNIPQRPDSLEYPQNLFAPMEWYDG